MKFSANSSRNQPTTFVTPWTQPMPVTLNSFAAFAAPGDIPDSTVARYAPGGDIYNQLNAKYGSDVALQVYSAAQQGDRGTISTILGSAIPLGQPGGGSVAQPLDESTSDAFWSQIYNEPLNAPIEQINKVLTNTGDSIASSTGITKTITLLGVGALAWFVLAHNK